MRKSFCLIFITFILIYNKVDAQTSNGSIIDTHHSPFALWKSVDLSNVAITGGFWADRLDINRMASFEKLWDLAVNPDEGHVLQNFRIAAGLEEGEFKGTQWQDEWMYKWIEAASYILAQDPKSIFQGQPLTVVLDEMIDIISKAQASDGYIATQRQIGNKPRFESPNHHEFYNMGHLLTAASVHYRITHQTNLLHVAERAAGYALNWFRTHRNDPASIGFPLNPSIIMGAVELYRATNKADYLELAELVVNSRGRSLKKDGKLISGSENNQNVIPLREETEVVGHAVFFTYLYAGATDIYLETGDSTLLNVIKKLWTDLTEKKMYVNGGISNAFNSLPTRKFKEDIDRTILKNDRINEGVDKPYNLTNFDAYNETCGMVGNMMWNWRLLQATGEAKYADIMELSFYNSILSGVNLSGDEWIYCNGLGWYGHDHETLHAEKQKWGSPGLNYICCPTNVLRNIAAYSGYLYTKSHKSLQIQQYTANSATIPIEGAGDLGFSMQTDFPWEGKIKLMVQKAPSSDSIEIAFRIPGWSNVSTMKLNNKMLDLDILPQSYCRIKRIWKKDDCIELNLDMSVKSLMANPKTEFDRNMVAIKRGPILYCLEEPDIPSHADIFNIAVNPKTKWKIKYEKHLLHGITTLSTNALLYGKKSRNIIGQYHEFPKSSTKIPIKLIPYFTWRNRGMENKMEVWIPVY